MELTVKNPFMIVYNFNKGTETLFKLDFNNVNYYISITCIDMKTSIIRFYANIDFIDNIPIPEDIFSLYDVDNHKFVDITNNSWFIYWNKKYFLYGMDEEEDGTKILEFRPPRLHTIKQIDTSKKYLHRIQ